MPISRALLRIYFGVPSKGAFHPGSPHRATSERDAPFLEPSFIHLLKSLVYEPPFRFSSRAPMERDACLQSLHLHILRVPSKGAPLQVPLTQLPQRETLYSVPLLASALPYRRGRHFSNAVDMCLVVQVSWFFWLWVILKALLAGNLQRPNAFYISF